MRRFGKWVSADISASKKLERKASLIASLRSTREKIIKSAKEWGKDLEMDENKENSEMKERREGAY